MLQNPSSNSFIEYDKWHKVCVTEPFSSEKMKWCSDRLSFPGCYNGWVRGAISFDTHTWVDHADYFFRDSEDAIAFKLSFGEFLYE